MPATATLIAIRNAQEHRDRIAAEAANRACGDHASCDVSSVAQTQDIVALQKRVEELQARIQAYQVAQPTEPYISINVRDFVKLIGDGMFAVGVIVTLVGLSFIVQGWWKKRGEKRGG